jgi:hypothetical protein
VHLVWPKTCESCLCVCVCVRVISCCSIVFYASSIPVLTRRGMDSLCSSYFSRTLFENRGFGVGFRSKRFAMLLEDGKSKYLVVDEGMDDCKSTAAPVLVKFLTPESDAVSDEVDLQAGGLVAAGGAVLLGLLVSLSGNDAAPAPKSAPTPPAAIQKAAPKTKAPSSEASKPSRFSLLETYGK